MTTNDWKTIFKVIVILGIALFGFYLGRKTAPTKIKTKIIYKPGEKVEVTVEKPVPYEVSVPADTADIIRACVKDGIYTELFPSKVITEYVEVDKTDTAAIMRDWAAIRKYSETVFDSDTLGKMVVNTEVQYNRLKNINCDYTPMIKEVETTKYGVRLFSPFVGVGASVNPWDAVKDPMGELSAGFFVKEKIGIQARYQHGFKSKADYVGGAILFKF